MSKHLATILLSLLFAGSMTQTGAMAQERIVTSIDSGRANSLRGFAREFRFTIITNYVTGGGKYYEMYVTSRSKTTVHIALGMATAQKFPVNAYQVLALRIPLAWEMHGSGVIEDKAIHVRSDDADLNVNVLSRNPATSGMMTIIPTASFDTEYIIASFNSYAYLPGHEYPSEFAVIANEDSTVVTITPTADLSQGFSDEIAYSRGKPFTVKLQKGQCVQYRCSAANGNMEDFDLSGTKINSNKPIGVVAGVQCANIPAENPYCDHITEMLLPVNRWGKRYFSAPFASRVGGDGFRVIAAEDATSVYRTDNTGKTIHCVLNQHETYMVHDITNASEWTSDKPFMLVQYLQSTDYPTTGANNGIGDPEMVVLTPVGSYQKEVIFQAPSIQGGESQFRNYVNLIVHKDAVNSTRMDDKQIGGAFTALPMGGTDHIVYRASDISKGTHYVVSDSGVGVYLYGYGSSDAIAYPGGGYGTTFANDSDRLAPQILSSTQECFTLNVQLAEEGEKFIGQVRATVDTIANAGFNVLSIEDEKNSKLSYRLQVLDPSKSMHARIRITDGAGNFRAITHSYLPSLPLVQEDAHVVAELGLSAELVIPIFANGYAMEDLRFSLRHGDHFEVVSAPQRIEAGETDTVRLRYTQTGLNPRADTLIIRSECHVHEVALLGSPAPFAKLEMEDTLDFRVVIIGDVRTRQIAVKNVGTEPWRLDSVTISGTSEFSSSVLSPGFIGSGDSTMYEIRFEPATIGKKQATVTAYTSIGTADLYLFGEARQSGSVSEAVSDQTITVYPNPASSELRISHNFNQVTACRIMDVAGKIVQTSVLRGTGGIVDISRLPNGSYLLEIESGQDTHRSKFSISR